MIGTKQAIKILLYDKQKRPLDEVIKAASQIESVMRSNQSYEICSITGNIPSVPITQSFKKNVNFQSPVTTANNSGYNSAQSGYSSGGNKECGYCMPGTVHDRKDCPSFRMYMSVRECYLCGEVGHARSECPKRTQMASFQQKALAPKGHERFL